MCIGGPDDDTDDEAAVVVPAAEVDAEGPAVALAAETGAGDVAFAEAGLADPEISVALPLPLSDIVRAGGERYSF